MFDPNVRREGLFNPNCGGRKTRSTLIIKAKGAISNPNWGRGKSSLARIVGWEEALLNPYCGAKIIVEVFV